MLIFDKILIIICIELEWGESNPMKLQVLIKKIGSLSIMITILSSTMLIHMHIVLYAIYKPIKKFRNIMSNSSRKISIWNMSRIYASGRNLPPSASKEKIIAKITTITHLTSTQLNTSSTYPG